MKGHIAPVCKSAHTRKSSTQVRKKPGRQKSKLEYKVQDYHRQLQGPPISRRALTTTIEKATPESIAATGEKGEATQRETNMTTGLDQIDALIALLAQQREEDRQRLGEQRQR